MLENYAMEFINKALDINFALGPLTLLFLFFGRMFPIIAQAPFLGARVLPHPVKVCLALSLFVIFLPVLLEGVSGPLYYGQWTLVLLCKELMIGTFIGFFVSVPFTVVQNAGIFIDHQRGGASLMVNDPTVQNQSSPLGTIFNFTLIYLFFTFDAPFTFFEMLIDLYRLLPMDQFLSPQFFERGSPFWQNLIPLFNKIMILSIQMAMPGLLIILMTDFFLGIANRLAPQVQISFLGMPLKSLLALLIVCLGWNVYVEHFAKDSAAWLGYMDGLFQMVKIGREGVHSSP